MPVLQPAAARKSRAQAAHLPALTGLRFPLALWVVLHHLTGPGGMLEESARALPSCIFALIRGGYLAVTTFFVLSGFVLAHGYGESRWTRRSVGRYALARVARIYPVYLLSLLAVAPFIWHDRTPGKAGYLAAHVALLQGWLGRIPVNWNTPAWSLSCEAFFYAVFPLAILFLPRRGWRGIGVLALAACCLTRILWAAGVSDGVKPLIHLSDFLMGIAAAAAYTQLRRNGHRIAGPWLYLPGAVLALALIAWPQFLPAPLDVNSTLRPLNALLLIGLAIGGGAPARLLASPVAQYLGKSSYALYILHVPLLWWYLRFTHHTSPIVYVAAAIAMSALVYRFVEEPANRWLRERFTPR